MPSNRRCASAAVVLGVRFGCLLGLLAPVASRAYEYHGRITTGAYASNETFYQPSLSGPTNDVAIFSNRFYLDVSRITSNDLSVVTDIRDKYDFFDKLSKELTSLTGSDTLQLRQLSVTVPERTRGFYGNFGRFPIPEAGSVYTDGAELGYRVNPDVNASVFAGLNPKRDDQPYVQYNPQSQDFGAYLLYQPKVRDWENTFYFSNAAVGEENFSHLDRFYWFENLIYQPNTANRFVSLSYLDFVPRVYVQNANLNFSHDFNERLTAGIGGGAMDVIAYTRQQGPLELLPPSPYRFADLLATYRLSRTTSLDLTADYGLRLADSLIRHEYLARINFAQFVNGHFSAYFAAGFLHDFVSDGPIAKFGGGYYSDRWEFTLDGSAASEKYDSGDELTPISLEASTALYLSKAVFATLSLQESRDQKVNILATFFKLGYRFGSREVPPIRDGAPPRGRL